MQPLSPTRPPFSTSQALSTVYVQRPYTSSGLLDVRDSFSNRPPYNPREWFPLSRSQPPPRNTAPHKTPMIAAGALSPAHARLEAVALSWVVRRTMASDKVEFLVTTILDTQVLFSSLVGSLAPAPLYAYPTTYRDSLPNHRNKPSKSG